ncbi:MAG TPA: hypothetical protein VI612_00205 [Candidatus Nanoarchaeia archaeon]|nr:hypothetical protein [Candidatus Nanoarchaeia archaeon]
MAKKYVRKWAKFKEGGLGGWSKSLPQSKRRAILEKLVKRDSYATVIRRLLQLRNVTKDEGTVMKASSDMLYLRKKFAKRPVVHKGRMC